MSDNSGQQAVTTFQQQGQVDWIALSNSTFGFTLGVLSRLNKAGVDSFTCSVGKIICKKLALTASGQERVQAVVSRLKGWPSYRNLIWFGFGERHLVHELALTEEGLTLVALCSAVQGTYGEMFGARVFRQLAIELKAPHELSPSLHQWRALISVCAGILCTGEFTKLLQSFIQYLSPREINAYKATEPEAIAKAIISLGNVAENRQNTHNFFGGLDCSWIAAVAEWFFDLSVEIRNPDGNIIYRSSFAGGMHGATPQIRITESSSKDDPVSILSRSALLPSTVNIIQPGNYLSGEYIRRVGWDRILRESFSERWLNKLLTGDIGKASSRLLRIMLVESLMYPTTLSSQEIKPNDCAPYASVLTSFIGTSKTKFPELSSWLNMAEDPLSLEDQKSWSDDSYNDTITRGCCCKLDSQILCLRLLFSVILELLYAFRDIEVQPDLLPTPSGVREAYPGSFCLNKCDATFTEEELMIEDKDQWMNPFKLRLSTMKIERFIKIIHRVYTGVHKFISIDDSYAVCGEGICVFYKALLYPNLSPAKSFQIVALPGIIEYKNTHYSDVTHPPRMTSFGFISKPASIPLERVSAVDLFVDETEERNILTVGFMTTFHSGQYVLCNVSNILNAVLDCSKITCKHQGVLLMKDFRPGHSYAVLSLDDCLKISGVSKILPHKMKTFELFLKAFNQNNDGAKSRSLGRKLHLHTVVDDFFALVDFSNGCWLLGFCYLDERLESSAVQVSFRGLSPNIANDRVSLTTPFASTIGMQEYIKFKILLLKPLCTRCILQLVSTIKESPLGQDANRIDLILMGSSIADFELHFDFRPNGEVEEEKYEDTYEDLPTVFIKR